MTQPIRPSPDPPTRSPVGHGRASIEGGILTALATIVVWALGLLPIEIPAEVYGAFSGLIVMTGTLAFSEWRNRQHFRQQLQASAAARMLVFLVPALVLTAACVTWDGSGYNRLAGNELLVIPDMVDTQPLNIERCDAHKQAFLALRDEQGNSTSLNAPFFAGQHIEALSNRHNELGSICYELVARDRERGLEPTYRGRVRAAWVRAWQNGRALQGGLKEE